MAPKDINRIRRILICGLVLLWGAFSAPGNGRAGPPPGGSFEEGLLLYRKGDYAPALKVFQRLGEETGDPRVAADSIFMQGQALRGLQNWPEAAQTFSRAAQTHPWLGDYALFSQGEALEKADEGEKSLGAYQRLVQDFPESLLVPQARLRMAEIYLQRGDYADAVETCDRILQGVPWKDSLARALFLLGQAREGLGQWPEAVKTYQELWLKAPLNGSAKKARTRWEFLIQEKKAPEEKIAPEALSQRALLLYQANSFEAALREMNQIQGYPPQSYPSSYAGEIWVDDLYFHRGMCHFRMKQYSQAVEAFDLLIGHSRNEGMAEKSLFWKFKTQVRNGRKEEALDTFSLFQAAYPRSTYQAQALYLKAVVYEDLGETEKAVSAYREAGEKFPQSPYRFAALWKAGWLLYKKNDLLPALQAWDQLKRGGPPARWMEKVLYWEGKALEKGGLPREAEEHFTRLSQDFPHSFYRQLKYSQGRLPAAPRGPFPPPQDPPLAPFLEGKADPPGPTAVHLEKGRVLTRLGLLPLAVGELEAAEAGGANLEEVWMEISRLYREDEEYYRSNVLVRKKFTLKPLSARPLDKERSLYRLAYPVGNPSLLCHYAQLHSLDPALLCALILEESRFQVQAVSPAGARGLMQVMPQTGRRIARGLRMRRFSAKKLFDPEVNIRLGSWYFARMLEEFGGKVHLALAAYNAGPIMVRKWLADGTCSGDDAFVENIPFPETRNYVIRVMGSAQVYRFLYWPQPEKPAQP
jgi:soluble lytic murein transglycosylase